MLCCVRALLLSRVCEEDVVHGMCWAGGGGREGERQGDIEERDNSLRALGDHSFPLQGVQDCGRIYLLYLPRVE
jgi:hypothetical protein